MNIGDRVRLLHDHMEGVVVKIQGNIAEVEIEEGFIIPVAANELVLIAKEENQYFDTTPPKASKSAKESSGSKEAGQRQQGGDKSPLYSYKGLYLAFIPTNDRLYQLYLINNTDWTTPYAVSKEQNGNHMGVAGGVLGARQYARLDEVNIEQFDSWGIYYFQVLFFRQGYYTLPHPLLRKLQFRASTFFKALQMAPILDKEGYVFQLDKDFQWKATEWEASRPMDAQQIIHSLLKQDQAEQSKIAVEVPEYEVDLHIEKLLPNHKGMSPDAIFAYQLDVFERKLDAAIASGMSEIIFIHGVGNGKLRDAIQKRAGRHPQVEFFQDAHKEKFGYGATLIKLKSK
ncbi:hypothetical protein FHS56_001626 [Thermonema lapsum]|uniref:Smr domain-containing protein n=1 Tax=Thermonema lapsum TaxID=28195 RepID=A0A846MRC6_9BACT|nr:Smr/MutS family protein [Thermonema lapsum]NIK74113.1 hypothetical protein [Thermonema lapsum]